MVEAIFSVIVMILEAVLKSKLKGKNKERSACKAVYFMYLSVCVIIDESEKILSEIEHKREDQTKRELDMLKESLLEIYRQTQIFIENAEHVDPLISIYESKTSKALSVMYIEDMSLFSSLDHIIEATGNYLQNTNQIVDYNPFNYAPIDRLWLSTFRFNRELSKIREIEGFKVMDISSLDDLLKLQQDSIDRIRKLKKEAEQLAQFIRKHCDFRDFIEVEKHDLNLWRYSRRPSEF